MSPITWITLGGVVAATVNIFLVFLQVRSLGKQVGQLERQYKYKREWDIRNMSLGYSALFHPQIRESKQKIQKNFNIFGRDDSIPEKEIVDRLKEDNELQVHINNVLTYYENIGLALQQKIVDEDIIFDMCGKTLVIMHRRLLNYIKHHRKISGNERLWVSFESSANAFNTRLNHTTEAKPLP